MVFLIRLFALALLAAPAWAEGEKAGDFDYYVMALSWNASWCEREGDARGADQCEAKHDYGFTLHGLWPQSEQGWPSYCRTSQRDPSRTMSKEMIDIMGSAGLAWYQWKKHGRCSGLSGRDYYRLSRAAYDSVKRPEILRKLPRDMDLPPKVIEDAFLEANPDLEADGVTVACRGGYIAEVRICLARDLSPRRCSYDVRRDCSVKTAQMPQMR
ncbi:MAG: ribonuclease T2 [Pseudomonadota bacterium]